MKKEILSVEDYADIIMTDDRERIGRETPTVYTDERIERVYEFADGAVVKYEWQTSPDSRNSATEIYNHRFTLVAAPTPNARKFKKGIIKTINYPRG